jgi:NTE family protein
MAWTKQPKVAFVLSGGASLGAIQVGMLRALNGAYIASHPQASVTAESLARIWRELRRGQVFPVNPLTGLLGFLGARDHLLPSPACDA